MCTKAATLLGAFLATQANKSTPHPVTLSPSWSHLEIWRSIHSSQQIPPRPNDDDHFAQLPRKSFVQQDFLPSGKYHHTIGFLRAAGSQRQSRCPSQVTDVSISRFCFSLFLFSCRGFLIVGFVVRREHFSRANVPRSHRLSAVML